MNLGQSYPTISEADVGNASNLSPSLSSVQLPKTRSVTNPFARSNRFHMSKFADEFKIHCEDPT